MPSAATVVVLAPSKTGSGNAQAVASVQQRPTTCVVKQVPQKKKKAVVKKTVKKKSIVKSSSAKKKHVTAKPKITPEKSVVKEKPVPLPQPNKNIEKMVPPLPAPEVCVAHTVETSESRPVCDAIAIAYADARLLHQYTVLQNELSKYWAPPPGMADNCRCQLTASIDRAGVVSDVVVQESSGALIFDITARSALLAVAWPVWSWGSSITITFKP